MKKQDIAKLKSEDLEKTLFELKKELFNLSSASLAGEDTQKKKARINSVKRNIARVLTRLNTTQ
jgi:ribosomal protein L29